MVLEHIVNLTQHPATPDQRAEGVFDLEGEAPATNYDDDAPF